MNWQFQMCKWRRISLRIWKPRWDDKSLLDGAQIMRKCCGMTKGFFNRQEMRNISWGSCCKLNNFRQRRGEEIPLSFHTSLTVPYTNCYCQSLRVIVEESFLLSCDSAKDLFTVSLFYIIIFSLRLQILVPFHQIYQSPFFSLLTN